MPGVDGREATRRLKSNSRTAHALVIVVTGHATTTTAEEVKAAGADGYLIKPCLPEDLYAAIMRLMKRQP